MFDIHSELFKISIVCLFVFALQLLLCFAVKNLRISLAPVYTLGTVAAVFWVIFIIGINTMYDSLLLRVGITAFCASIWLACCGIAWAVYGIVLPLVKRSDKSQIPEM